MDPAILFRLCNLAVLPGWAMLVLLPRWRLTRELIPAVILPLLLAMVYLFLAAVYFGTAKGGFGSLHGVSALFQDPHVLLAGWIHYLVFDLFIGSWELRDSQALGISHLVLIPSLVLTFMFGPVGLLLYFIVRVTMRHQLQITPRTRMPDLIFEIWRRDSRLALAEFCALGGDAYAMLFDSRSVMTIKEEG